MPMLADLIDAVIGVDTHRDTHHAELALPTGAAIATCSISNDSAGYAQLLTWIADHAPGPRLVISIEGTRSYGAGLARAAAAAGLRVIECEQPTRARRRGKGKSDPIDAHLAVLTALQLHADKLPTPRADGDREALRILLCARQFRGFRFRIRLVSWAPYCGTHFHGRPWSALTQMTVADPRWPVLDGTQVARAP